MLWQGRDQSEKRAYLTIPAPVWAGVKLEVHIMLKANQKVRVINDTPFISKGTVVRIEENKETKEIETGKTGMILCAIQPFGSLFFDAANLAPID